MTRRDLKKYYGNQFQVMDTTELKELSYRCMFDKGTKMSARVATALLYFVIRLGDVIDWWFPLKGA